MWVFLLASSYNLTAMSIERHGAITRPLKHNEHVVRRRFPLTLILVYIPVIIHLLPTYISSHYVDGACRINLNLQENVRYSLTYVAMFMDLIIPGSIMLVCYIRMAMFLKNAMRPFCGNAEKLSSFGKFTVVIFLLLRVSLNISCNVTCNNLKCYCSRARGRVVVQSIMKNKIVEMLYLTVHHNMQLYTRNSL